MLKIFDDCLCKIKMIGEICKNFIVVSVLVGFILVMVLVICMYLVFVWIFIKNEWKVKNVI